MATHYISEIRNVQPNGPYFLGGNCFGGVIAFEVARQLRTTGDEIGLLAMIDTGYAVGSIRSTIQKHLHKLSRKSMRGKIAHVGVIATGFLDRVSIELHRAWSSLRPRSGAESAPAALSLRDVNHIAQWHYRAKPYDGPAVLFYTGAPHNHLGWRNVIRKGLRMVELPAAGQDDDHLVQSPHVKHLADALRELLRKAKD